MDAIGKFWQSNYYEHIILNEDELNKIRQYIRNKTSRRDFDGETPERIAKNVLEDEIFEC